MAALALVYKADMTDGQDKSSEELAAETGRPKSLIVLRAPDSAATSSDDELIARLALGDTESLEILYKRHTSTLLGVAGAVLRDRALAEDVVHDVFVALGERVQSYRPERGSVPAWLATITRNLAIDRARRHARTSSTTIEVALRCVADETRSPEMSAEWTMTHPRIARAIDRLTADQRRTLEVMFFDGLSFAEVAEAEGTPIGTVKSRAARAIAALRDELRDDRPRRRRRPRKLGEAITSSERAPAVVPTRSTIPPVSDVYVADEAGADEADEEPVPNTPRVAYLHGT
jgi:RNA polymerase sigma-70 factor (ECF subfamily)